MKILLPLFCGSLIYYFFREQSFNAAFFYIDNKKLLAVIEQYSILQIIIGSLPDFSWAIALLYSLSAIWNGTEQIPAQLLYSVYILILLTEFFQWKKWIAGTADYYDVAAYLLAIIIHLLNKKVNS